MNEKDDNDYENDSDDNNDNLRRERTVEVLK
jgi:hypothetical protein